MNDSEGVEPVYVMYGVVISLLAIGVRNIHYEKYVNFSQLFNAMVECSCSVLFSMYMCLE